MDIEQLTLLVDLARDAGQGAFVILILWALKGYFMVAAWVGLVGVLACKIIHTIRETHFSTELLRLSGATVDYNCDWKKTDKNKLREAARRIHPKYRED